MNREEWDIRLLEYWQGESLSPEAAGCGKLVGGEG